MNADFVLPEGMTAEKLRNIADWLDTYDAVALSYFDLHEMFLETPAEELVEVRAAAAGTEVQDDLRRWADQIDGSEREDEQ